MNKKSFDPSPDSKIKSLDFSSTDLVRLILLENLVIFSSTF